MFPNQSNFKGVAPWNHWKMHFKLSWSDICLPRNLMVMCTPRSDLCYQWKLFLTAPSRKRELSIKVVHSYLRRQILAKLLWLWVVSQQVGIQDRLWSIMNNKHPMETLFISYEPETQVCAVGMQVWRWKSIKIFSCFSFGIRVSFEFRGRDSF